MGGITGVKAEYYAERLTNYLLKNQNIYTLWLNHNSDETTIEPDMDNYQQIQNTTIKHSWV
ncbi:MAG: hypothetical protein HPY57_15440 [Ignavibacteria bacterium]|nr:hypothetical protein [Ignavibacteria bacterium]